MNNFTNSFCLNEEFELSGFEDSGKMKENRPQNTEKKT